MDAADRFFVGSRPAANIAAFTFPVWAAWSIVVVCQAAPILMAAAIVLWVTIGR